MCASWNVAVLLLLFYIQGSLADEQRNDPCYRTCEEGQTRTCEYDFTVGEYVTMRQPACEQCSTEENTLGNAAACRVPGCISGGGRVRVVAAVNHQVPGPKIEVCEGDRVVVRVTNLFASEGAVMHWHGTHQKETPYMDGAPYLTQCPILPHTSFTYNFTVDTPGTHMWHAHIGHQEADGVFGTMIVRRPASKEPHSNLYDEDLPEHTMIVWHWFGRTAGEVLLKAKYVGSSSAGEGLIINGLGGLEVLDTSSETDTFNTMPREIFTVEPGKRYRFRVIYNTAIPCPVQLSVDKHKLLAIASDSASFEAREVDSIFLNGGERYDFVLEANQQPENYWIRFRGLGGCTRSIQVHQEAILHYETVNAALPAGLPTYAEANVEGVLLNPIGEIFYDYSKSDIIYVSQLENVDTEQAQDISGPSDQTIYIEFKSSSYSEEDILGPWPQVNSRTFSYPPFPLLSQRDEITRDMYCTDEDECLAGKFCACPYLYDIKLDSLVEIVFVDLSNRGGDHPFHLHGGQFHVVALDIVKEGITTANVKEQNEKGQISKNFDGPIKDTVSVPSGGYAVIRFIAENPGFWFFHCHISSHADLGMGFVLKIGDLDEMPDAPDNFPRCGNWETKYKETTPTEPPNTTIPDSIESTTPSGAVRDAPAGAVLMLLCCLVFKVVKNDICCQ